MINPVKTTFLLFYGAMAAHADIIRLSSVVENAGPGITRFELGEGDDAQILFVEDKAIITETDIAQALPSPSREDSIDISLSKEGTEKMIAATGIMRPAIDRIAILVDGKILSAPVVQSVPLGKYFVINGLDEENEAMKLAARLSGRSGQEIADDLAAREQRLKDLPPRPEPVYHTEEEYRQLKAERDKIGLHFMDRTYSEGELDKLLKVGMKEAEVIAIFGKPRSITRKEDGTSQFAFETAPEKRPFTPQFHMEAFDADFSSEELTRWGGFRWSRGTLAPKPPQRNPGNLIIKTPPADMSSEDFDLIAFYEAHEISLKPGKKKPTIADHYDLIGILWALCTMAEDGQSIDSQCDIMGILATAVPEMAALVKKSPQGRIAFTEITTTVQPYITGEKEFK